MSAAFSDTRKRTARALSLPSGRSVLWLFAEPSSYLLILAALFTFVAKAAALGRIDSAQSGPLFFSAFHTIDVCVFLGLAAVFAAGESLVPRLRWVTGALSAAVLAFAAINAPVLVLTGAQLDPDTIAMGWSRFHVASGVLGDALRGGFVWLFLGLAVVVVTPMLLRRWLSAGATPKAPVRDRHRALVALFAAVAAAVLWGASAPMTTIATQELQKNAIVGSYKNLVAYGYQHDWGFGGSGASGASGGELRPFAPETLISGADIEGLRDGARPNVLLVVLESTRFDHVQNPDDSEPQVETPHLLALAKRGVWAKSAYAAFPHTTKSLFSILCGRLPTMQADFFETGANPTPQCLPNVLKQAGYNTYFSQSAVGAFERRPVLARFVGYDAFKAWEEIGGEPLGYLSSDDLTLAAPFDDWLASVDPQEPFMATVLTSGTHHPYRLSTPLKAKLVDAGIDPDSLSEAERYAKLVEVEDELVGALIATLESRDLLDNTLVVIVADHGEGFGDKGVLQHDNNFYQEGLHVPVILAGPGVPQAAIEKTASLIDVMPTVLDVLDVPWARPNDWEFGLSLLERNRAARASYFACFYNNQCAGFIEGDIKVVAQMAKGRAFYFDLANDPTEGHPKRLSAPLRERLNKALDQMSTHRFAPDLLQVEDTPVSGEWKCPGSDPCVHPNTPEGGLFSESGS